jgi:hypothetical protein
VEIRLEARDRERETPAVGKRKGAREKKNREEKEEWNSPKDLCTNLENCRDLSVKHKFHINLKPE